MGPKKNNIISSLQAEFLSEFMRIYNSTISVPLESERYSCR